MNIHVVLLSFVLAAFIGLWSSDHAATSPQQAPVEQNQYDPTGRFSARPAPSHLTSVHESKVTLTLPTGIAPGRYIAVNQLGVIKSINVDVAAPGKLEEPKHFYESTTGENRWFFVRIDEEALEQIQKTAILPDGPSMQ